MNTFKRFGNYSLFLVWGLILIVSLFFPTTPITLLAGLLFLLYLPGFSLARLLRIPTDKNRYEAWMLYLGVGFIANLLICWLAIVTYANINILLVSYTVLLVLVFSLALIFDLRRKAIISANLELKEIFRAENLIYLVPLVLITLVLLTINILGANFSGDPTYHISIIRKAVDGGRFGVAELSFLKNQPQVQYAYPVWLVWLGLLSKVFHLSIASVWDQIIVGLTVISALAWGWVFQKIFNLKLISILAVCILFITSLTNNAYLLASFAVPDTICKLFILPMSLALVFHFLEGKSRNWMILGLVTLMQFLAAIIHSTQYVYYFFILGGYGLFYALIFWRDPLYSEADASRGISPKEKYKENLKRILWLIIAPICFYIPFLIFLQLQYHVLSDSLAWFATSRLILIYGAFKDYEPLMKLAFILLPLTVLFWRRSPKVLFLSIIMMITPVIYYFEPLRDFISLKLSFVLVRRMFSNLVWYFGVLGFIFGFFILSLNRLINLIKSGRAKTILTIIIAMIGAILIFFDYKFKLLKQTHQAVFGPAGSEFMQDNLFWIVISLSIMVLGLIIIRKYSRKLDEFFVLEPPSNHIVVFVLAALVVFWFASDARPLFTKSLAKQAKTTQFFRAIPDLTAKGAQTEDIGGDDVLNFIKNDLPKRPIIETSSGFRDLSQLADVYMSSWPGAFAPDKELSNLYRTDTPMNEKFACLSYYKVEYFLLTELSSRFDLLGFSQAPQYLTPIFTKTNILSDGATEKVQIFKVNTDQIQKDYYFMAGDQPPLCRAAKYRE